LRKPGRLSALLLSEPCLVLLNLLRCEEDLDLLPVRRRLHSIGLAFGGEEELSPSAAPTPPSPSPAASWHQAGTGRGRRLSFGAARVGAFEGSGIVVVGAGFLRDGRRGLVGGLGLNAGGGIAAL